MQSRQSPVPSTRDRGFRALRTVLVVLAVTALTFAIRAALTPYVKDAGLMGFPFAVMVSAWIGGFYAGLLATSFGAVLAFLFYTSPTFSMDALHLKDVIYMISGVGQGIVISFLARKAEASQAAARLALAQAEQANQAKSQFLANMSHEIRTPLGVMLGFSELTQEALKQPDQESIDEANAHLNSIQRNGRQLMHLINELLDLSKVEADRIEIERSLFSPADLFDEIEEMFQPRASRKNLQIEFETQTPIPDLVVGDAFRIKQILMNLISNAVKFTDKGTVRVTVHFEQASDFAGSFCVRVRDSGIGIAHDQVSRLFQPFTQAESSTTRRFGGTGLGLALSLRLAHLMDGELMMESSEVGKGTTFALRLPIIIEQRKQDQRGRRSPKTSDLAKRETGPRHNRDIDISHVFIPATASARADSAAHNPKTRLQGLSVLLVEDSLDNQEVISRFIRGAGGRVTLANDGIESLAKINAEAFDVVLMDIQMPRMNGHDATIEARRLGHQVPIIALTAYALPEERVRCLQAGCNDHLTKPVDRTALIATLECFLKPKLTRPIETALVPLDDLHSTRDLQTPPTLTRPKSADANV